MAVKIIGCGHPARGDDAAGPLAIERLRELGVDACLSLRDGLSLLELWGPEDEVALVDAFRTEAEPGQICVWDAVSQPLDSETMYSTHAVGVREAIEVGRLLNRLPRSLRVYGISGREFGLGAAPCSAVREAAVRLANELARAASDSAS